MWPVTATAGRPDGRPLTWQPRRFAAVALLISSLVSWWLLSPIFWDRRGGDSRAAYAAARLHLRGGDPYSFPELKREESAIDAATRAPSAPSHYSANPYYYPPVMTRLWEGLAPLGDRGFYWVGAAVLLLPGLLGRGLILSPPHSRPRSLPLASFPP